MLRNGTGRSLRHSLTAATMVALTLVMMPLNGHCEENESWLQILIKMAGPQKAQKPQVLSCPSTPHCPMGVCTGAACPWYCPANCYQSTAAAVAPTGCAQACHQRIIFIPCPATLAACATLAAAVDGTSPSCPAGCTNCPLSCPATCTKCQAACCLAGCTNCPSSCPATCTQRFFAGGINSLRVFEFRGVGVCKMKEAKVKKILEMYAALMRDGKYEEARILALRGLELDPENTSLTAAATIASMKIQEQLQPSHTMRNVWTDDCLDEMDNIKGTPCETGSTCEPGRASQAVENAPGCEGPRHGSCERAARCQEVQQLRQLCVEQQNTIRQMATVVEGMQQELAAMRGEVETLRTVAPQYRMVPQYPNSYGSTVPLQQYPVQNYNGWGVYGVQMPGAPMNIVPNQN